ncbi:phosphoadenosine phosphosulfate reductase family protein [Lutibacter sp. B2]|nr:phosphoadenosine phosphosulfate reductase family protein [Lutibacter sp. B2]
MDYKCPDCGNKTMDDVLIEIYWCNDCKVPIIREIDFLDKESCPLCKGKTIKMSNDLRPVFPEERLLMELILGKPLEYINSSVWCDANRYYIDGERVTISTEEMKTHDVDKLRDDLNKYSKDNNYDGFNIRIEKFIEANRDRFVRINQDAINFIKPACEGYSDDQLLVSFSGGKDSTVVSDLVIRVLSNPEIKHIFGDTTLEFPLTLKYRERFQRDNINTVLSSAKNREKNFYEVCDEIGPPSRVMRWCCHMFKTGPIGRKIGHMFRNKNMITFYGVRRFESTSRSKYERIYDSPKIAQQKVVAPIFNWKDIDIWLYLLTRKVDFNDAYRYGYDRVGCWCCPNNSGRSHLLSQIYMPDQSNKWREFLVNFAKKIGKPDPEEYVDSGNWKARQGGYGVEAAMDVEIEYSNCTTDNNAQIYKLNKPIIDAFYELFTPLGKISKELGRKLIGEVIVLNHKTNMPKLSIQPFNSGDYEIGVKIQILETRLNKLEYDKLERQISYQVRKYNACKGCLGCEAVCKYRAISIRGNSYHIDESKCTRCGKCVDPKYITKGCLMAKYLYSAK